MSAARLLWAAAVVVGVGRCAVVEELKFVADAKALEAAEGGVVVVGLFGAGDTAEKRAFMEAATSREFQDEGWDVAWSGEAKIVAHFNVETPSMVVYRVFDADGAPCEPTPEAYDAARGGGWTFRSLKAFIFAVSFPPVSLFPVPEAPRALREPLDTESYDDDDAYDAAEEERVDKYATFLRLRTKENIRLQAALKQTTVLRGPRPRGPTRLEKLDA